eukprot:1626338-Lingulodinium_polyedra.AAC.1
MHTRVPTPLLFATTQDSALSTMGTSASKPSNCHPPYPYWLFAVLAGANDNGGATIASVRILPVFA